MNEDLRRALDDAVHLGAPHVERMTLAAAIVSTALERAGMRATLVGGGAIEFYAPGAHTTADIDFVVEGGATRETLAPVFESLGLAWRDRHWVIGDFYVEVPGLRLDDPSQAVTVGGYRLRVIAKEIVLGERIVGYRYWKYWGYGQQAVAMIRAFGATIDEDVLRGFLRRDQAEEAYELLRGLAESGREITEEELDRLWHSRYR